MGAGAPCPCPSDSVYSNRLAGCGGDQGHGHPGFALQPMELRPGTSHKENVPPRPATPLRPGKRLNGSGSEMAGAASPLGIGSEPRSSNRLAQGLANSRGYLYRATWARTKSSQPRAQGRVRKSGSEVRKRGDKEWARLGPLAEKGPPQFGLCQGWWAGEHMCSCAWGFKKVTDEDSPRTNSDSDSHASFSSCVTVDKLLNLSEF